MSALTHAAFRRASQALSEELLPRCPERFWALFATVVPTHPKAYLVTFLKAAVAIDRAQRGFVAQNLASLRSYLEQHASAIDTKKTMEALLPRLEDPQAVAEVVQWQLASPATEQLRWLLTAGTPACLFVLLKLLETTDARSETVRACCLTLMKKGSPECFNMACMLQAYFGIAPLPGSFSLKLAPYELARLSHSYENFCCVLHGRPLAERHAKP